ncbi:hypothetical protein GCM10023147_37610 [Tsukamurella soli]|uniref:Uncharacterized protein n=1 Tax=Tsukamurella soli TaxID=644556 RepID=A0ABP8K3W6_9ACTN
MSAPIQPLRLRGVTAPCTIGEVYERFTMLVGYHRPASLVRVQSCGGRMIENVSSTDRKIANNTIVITHVNSFQVKPEGKSPVYHQPTGTTTLDTSWTCNAHHTRACRPVAGNHPSLPTRPLG